MAAGPAKDTERGRTAVAIRDRALAILDECGVPILGKRDVSSIEPRQVSTARLGSLEITSCLWFSHPGTLGMYGLDIWEQGVGKVFNVEWTNRKKISDLQIVSFRRGPRGIKDPAARQERGHTRA